MNGLNLIRMDGRMSQNKYYSLFLDDQRQPKQVTWVELPPVEWVVVRNYKEFVDYISVHGPPARVSFDHDLALEHYPIFETNAANNPTVIPYASYKEKTGYDCAKWLINYCMMKVAKLPECYVHTLNPIGRDNIDSIIKSYQSYSEKYE
jgi:hypothetical protein